MNQLSWMTDMKYAGQDVNTTRVQQIKVKLWSGVQRMDVNQTVVRVLSLIGKKKILPRILIPGIIL